MPKINDRHTDIVWARVDDVVQIILSNDRFMKSKRNNELCTAVMERFDIAPRTAQRYIAEAKKEIRNLNDKDKEEAYTKAIMDREFLYRQAIAPTKAVFDEEGNISLSPDYRLALDVVKDRDKIKGLYVENIDVKANVNTNIDLSKLTTEELKALANAKTE